MSKVHFYNKILSYHLVSVNCANSFSDNLILFLGEQTDLKKSFKNQTDLLLLLNERFENQTGLLEVSLENQTNLLTNS